MQAKDMRDMAGDELAEQLGTFRKELFGLRFANATGELEDTASMARTRRDVARALTVTRERNLDPKTGRKLGS